MCFHTKSHSDLGKSLEVSILPNKWLAFYAYWTNKWHQRVYCWFKPVVCVLWTHERKLACLNKVILVVSKIHKIYILPVRSLLKFPGVPLPTDRNPSWRLQPTWMPLSYPYNKASRKYSWKPLRLDWMNEKKRKCHQFHLRRFQIESDNESTSKGNADPTVFKRHCEQHIQGY